MRLINNEAPIVTVMCFTYNQKLFVKQCIESILMQKTTFAYEVLVHDDASSDGTKNIIEEYAIKYPRIIKPVFEVENLYSKGSFWRVFDRVIPLISGKYISFCEGDDYWIDSQKLQRQYEFMEGNQEYMLCFHSIKEVYEGRHHLDKQRTVVENREYSGIEWYKTRPAQTASYFFKGEIFESELYKMVSQGCNFLATDIPLLLICAKYGKLRGMSDLMSVYRHNEDGWTSKKRNKPDILKVINSQLEYKIFGKEFEKVSLYFYQRDCISAFLGSIKRLTPDFVFLKMSLNISLKGTLKAFYKVLQHKYD